MATVVRPRVKKSRALAVDAVCCGGGPRPPISALWAHFEIAYCTKCGRIHRSNIGFYQNISEIDLEDDQAAKNSGAGSLVINMGALRAYGGEFGNSRNGWPDMRQAEEPPPTLECPFCGTLYYTWPNRCLNTECERLIGPGEQQT